MPKSPQRSYQVGNHTIYHGDCTKVEPGGLFHAILCDPPYHLVSGNAVYDYKQHNGKRKATGGGFMGKKWDGGDIAFLPETWARLAEHLHPGGFLMAFASSRGWHRLACAIEDAGLRIHPSVFCLWTYATGFPKATRIDTQVDKAAGMEQRVIGPRVYAGGHLQNTHKGKPPIGTFERTVGTTTDKEPATDLARTWTGHRYGGQALKPAAEPIIVAQKPYAGKPVASITSTGAGALWIDGGRIGTRDCNESGWSKTGSKASNNLAMSGPNYAREAKDEIGLGRWPANFIIGDDEAAARLDEMGERRLVDQEVFLCYDCLKGDQSCKKPENQVLGATSEREMEDGIVSGESREAEKFSHNLKAVGCGKLPTDQSKKGLKSTTSTTTKQITESKTSSLLQPSGTITTINASEKTTKTLMELNTEDVKNVENIKPLIVSGSERQVHTEGIAKCVLCKNVKNGQKRIVKNTTLICKNGDERIGPSRFFFRVQEQLDEADPVFYTPKASRRERDAGLEGMPLKQNQKWNEGGIKAHREKTAQPMRNAHPTIKPTSLTKYLATLLLPPAEYAPRRLLVPFAGAGSEMIGAMQAGWEEVVGIEMEADYVELARKRLEYWSKKEGVKSSKSVTQSGYQPCLWD